MEPLLEMVKPPSRLRPLGSECTAGAGVAASGPGGNAPTRVRCAPRARPWNRPRFPVLDHLRPAGSKFFPYVPMLLEQHETQDPDARDWGDHADVGQRR